MCRTAIAAKPSGGPEKIWKGNDGPRGGPQIEHVPFSLNRPLTVMAGLVPVIHVDPRDKPGDDDLGELNGPEWTLR